MLILTSPRKLSPQVFFHLEHLPCVCLPTLPFLPFSTHLYLLLVYCLVLKFSNPWMCMSVYVGTHKEREREAERDREAGTAHERQHFVFISVYLCLCGWNTFSWSLHLLMIILVLLTMARTLVHFKPLF